MLDKLMEQENLKYDIKHGLIDPVTLQPLQQLQGDEDSYEYSGFEWELNERKVKEVFNAIDLK